MTAASNQQEPSMEEILSSIRRIIADEQEDGEAKDEHGENDHVLAEAATPAGEDMLDSEPEQDAEDEDIFDLTDVVSEPPEPPDASDVTEAEMPDDFDGPEESLFDDPPPMAEEPIAEPLAAMDEFEPVAQAADGDAFVETDLDDEIEMTLVPESEPESEPEPEISSEPEIVEEPAPILETAAVAKQAEDMLISDATAVASASSLAKLAKVASGDKNQSVDGGGRTIEEFMADLARPMLKEWMDENLNGIVERVVEQEVKKLVRRAELM